ncbi:MAG: DegT/DnrJ/EryC1/StrS family aminotransferase, partial [archaeon]|nr:DegT/DnrJ/EryC1/StrS family aminotransferase [archaeon]
MNESQKKARDAARAGIKEFFDLKEEEKFVPGKSRVQYAGAFFDENEVNAVVDSLLDGWLGLSKSGRALEKALAEYVGGQSSVLANSGSSANLLALATLKCKESEVRLKDGDEVIVPACSFPTTVNP